MSHQSSYTVQPEDKGSPEDRAVTKRDGVLSSVLCRISIFWPVRFTVRALRGLWWLLGFSPERPLSAAGVAGGVDSPSARQWRCGRKRVPLLTRVLLALLPRRLQGALGLPVCTSIGCAVSPEVRCSPTKPSGKGSKRKQEALDEEEDEDEEEEQQSWVEALTQELADEDQTADPDYEPSAVETDSEEYCSHNNTESDVEVDQGVVLIKDLDTGLAEPK